MAGGAEGKGEEGRDFAGVSPHCLREETRLAWPAEMTPADS